MSDAPELFDALDEACGEAFGQGLSADEIVTEIDKVGDKWAQVAEVSE
jgi:hypothetical protein